MSRPRLLDLFCGAGGAAMGYHRAGFDVVGVDIKPQPHYPFEFHQMDATKGLARMFVKVGGFDAIHASPPCQPFTRAGHLRAAQRSSSSEPDLMEPTRELLSEAGKHYIIENVPGAPVEGLFLCGSMFGLRVRRHRIFESNLWIGSAGPCRHREQGKPVGIYHRMGSQQAGRDRKNPSRGRFLGGRTASDIHEARAAMGIEWMDWHELKLALPPAYTEHIGRQLLAAIARRAA